MKKLLMTGMIGVILFLTACSSRISGETVTVCQNVGTSGWGIGETTVTIEGMDESIRVWTAEIIFDREEYINRFWAGHPVTNEDITEWFDSPDSRSIDNIYGVNWYLVSIDDETVVTRLVYNYELISEDNLSMLWDVDSFSREITLTGVIFGLENEGATCRTN